LQLSFKLVHLLAPDVALHGDATLIGACMRLAGHSRDILNWTNQSVFHGRALDIRGLLLTAVAHALRHYDISGNLILHLCIIFI